MKPFKNILYVFQSSSSQETAMARAVSLARNNQSRLTIVDVIPERTLSIRIPPDGPSAEEFREAVIADRKRELQALADSCGEGLDVHIEVFVGIKFLEVIRAVLRDSYDLVIKVAEDPDWIERLFGSDDMHLLRKCPCPVWLMRAEEKNDYDCIVAAVDFDTGDLSGPRAGDTENKTLNQQIIDLGASLAISDFAQLHLAHAWDASEAGFASLWTDQPEVAELKIVEAERARHHSGMEALSHELRERIGSESYDYLSPRVHLPRGAPRKVIPQLVKDLGADLVVMGTVARTGIRGLFIGNTAEAILDQLQCSVLAVKPAGFVSPVVLE